MTTQHCARCKRPAPDQESAEFLDWEALGGEGDQVVCPGCLTAAEEDQILADAAATYDATLVEAGMIRLYIAAETAAARHAIDYGFTGIPRWAYADPNFKDEGQAVEYVEFRDTSPTGFELSRTTETDVDVRDAEVRVEFQGPVLASFTGDFILAIDVPLEVARAYEARSDPPGGWAFREYWLPPEVANQYRDTLIVFDSNDGSEVRADLVGK